MVVVGEREPPNARRSIDGPPFSGSTVDSLRTMCRNITTLRGLEPAATDEEIEAAARQFVRKVSGVQKTSANTEAAFEQAVHKIAHITEHLLAELPPRQQPPPTLPPLRRIAARKAEPVTASA